MLENSYRGNYFIWLCRQSLGDKYAKYQNLLRYLFETEFLYTIAMDEDRYKDGISLRYQYGWIFKLNDYDVSEFIDIAPCSVLEMMFALAKRMDEEWMYNPFEGNRISVWFEDMLKNMHISQYTDDRWGYVVEDAVKYQINNMMQRRYLENGDGGLFRLYSTPNVDLRRINLWDQMLKKCNELLR